MVEVLDGPRQEWDYQVAEGFTAWKVSATQRRLEYDVRVKPEGSPSYQVNLDSTQGHDPDIGIGTTLGDVLVFAQVPRDGTGQWSVRVWDLVGEHFLPTPDGVNTQNRAEGLPAIAGDYLAYNRSGTVRLHVLSTDVDRLVARAPNRGSISLTSMAGDFLSYYTCPRRGGRCDSFRYQISTRTTIRMPDGGRATYNPTVASDGTMYFVQGHPTLCGRFTRLQRWSGGTTTTLELFPNGIEVGQTEILEVADPDPDQLFFARVDCDAANFAGIYRIDVVA